ncbi:MAG TPA: YciI family protein [Planctomycetota bacterium]|nr:YciI family protein [Planctomycetota bacterium]
MRYVCMHKVGPSSEAGLPPSPELVAGMGQLIGETAKTGMFLAGGGLKPSRDRLRLTFAQGRCTVTPGPLVGGNELPASFATIKVKTRDEGIEWAKRYAAAVGAEEIELGLMTEPWDLGVCAKPEGAPLQFMILNKATKATEAGIGPSPKQAAELARLTAEMTRAGVLTFVETLQPSNQAVRLRYRNGKRTVIDGPFAESKELIGGFCMVQMHSLDEVLEWSNRFAKIINEDMEMDIRLAGEAKDAAQAGQ